MSTETELALASVTREELDEGIRWLNLMLDAWGTESQKSGFSTDGPWFALKALELALLREVALRHGADAWYAGMPTDGHPAARLLRFFIARLQLNPEVRDSPRLSAAGVLMARCLHCKVEKPLTVAFYERGERLWNVVCRECTTVNPERYRDLVISDEDQTLAANERTRDALSVEMAAVVRERVPS